MTPEAAQPPLLRVHRLTHRYRFAAGRRSADVLALDEVELTLSAGETLAVVGESGAGKTTLAWAVAGLLRPTAGSIWLAGVEWANMSEARRRPLRRAVQMIFQDSAGTLDPRMTVAALLEEPLRLHRVGGPAARRAQVAELMERVGLAARLAERRPGELSGGERQRVGIARALALAPRLIVADEPVSALDTPVAARIVDLLADLQQERGLAYLMVAHRLALVRALAHRVAVMVKGRVVEVGPTEAVLARPRHPYSQRLVAAEATTVVTPGEWTWAGAAGVGCPIAAGCPRAFERCRVERPALRGWEDRAVACHLAPDPPSAGLDPDQPGML